MFDMEDWKDLLTADFREWLDSIEDEPLPDENKDSEMDMLAFYSELTALRQELGIQTRCTRKSSQEMLETLSGLKDSLTKSSLELETALRDVKSQIPQIRMQAEEFLLLEILRLWEALSENVQQFKKQKLRGFFSSKADAAMLQNEQRKQELMLKKSMMSSAALMSYLWRKSARFLTQRKCVHSLLRKKVMFLPVAWLKFMSRDLKGTKNCCRLLKSK